MQFVQNGPDIPDALLQAHEEGRVVFFCGAGISRPAGLPGFDGLVSDLYTRVGEHPNRLESEFLSGKKLDAIESLKKLIPDEKQHDLVIELLEKQISGEKQLDRVIGLLEQRIQGGRKNVRRHLPDILKPNLLFKRHALRSKRHALRTHWALLILGRNEIHGLRLLTTNFDTLFERAAEHFALPPFTTYPTPPDRPNWEGIVHLHGRLSDSPTGGELDSLILSDGDFGQAYLTQGWAARFVATLFRDFTLCFVGYSIDDPVLRYMTAAHGLSRNGHKVFAFAPYSGDQAATQEGAWRAKNVTPILYDEAQSHRKLHQTLHIWASIFRDGVRGKQHIVSRLAHRSPKDSTPTNDFVSRMLWALSDKSGRPAQRFAELEPVPSLEWLDTLSDYRYHHSDLPRFQVPVRAEPSTTLTFSLLNRPPPYDKAPRMTLVTGIWGAHDWDNVMRPLAHWLTRHLDDPELLLWLAEKGGKLDSQFIQMIESKLGELASLERDGKSEELARIRAAAPRAIPRPMMRTLWRLFLSGRIKTGWQEFGIYQWQQRLQRDGLTFAVRMDLRALLNPTLKLKKPPTWGAHEPEYGESDDLRRSISWTLELAGTDVHSFLPDLEGSAPWQAALPSLATDFQQLLRDALDLMHELGEADEHEDPSLWHVPSLCSPRPRFRFNTWITLVELVRDAWLAVLKDDPPRARQTALSWFAEPFPIFKRLGLFAATREGINLPVEWLNCLLADQSRYLWAGETKSETLLLLEHKGNTLSDGQREQIEAAILTGPPQVVFRSGADPERIAAATDWLIWERLASLARSCSIGETAQARLNSLTASHPSWQLATDTSNEATPPGMGSGWDEFKSLQKVDHAPRTRRELVEWLRRDEPRDFFETDDWHEVCGTRMFVSSAALCDLAQEGVWPVKRWHAALQTWRDEQLVSRAWRLTSPLLKTIPETALIALAQDLSLWLRSAAGIMDRHEDVFLDLCRRIVEQPDHAAKDTDKQRTEAVNDSVVAVTQALLNFWFRRPLRDNSGLPDDVGPLLTQVCDTHSDPYRAGRGILASRLVALFRVAPAWTQKHLLPLFDWSNLAEARALWAGFLCSPHHYHPLVAFKAHFLETARHYDELDDRAERYATLLTYAALDHADTFAARELYDAFSSLPLAGLQASVQSLVRAQEASGDQREESWRNRIHIFWHDVWPKSHELNSKGIAEHLARLAIAARGEFPAAMRELQYWFSPQTHPDDIVHLLWRSGLCERFPQDALQLLSAIIDERSSLPGDLEKCLKSILQAWPEARHDTRYQLLDEYLHRKPGL